MKKSSRTRPKYAEIRDAVTTADLNLAASGIMQRAIKVGDRAPDFRLPDAHGGYVSSAIYSPMVQSL